MFLETLLEIPIFQGLSVEKMRDVISKVPLNFRKYEEKESIVLNGESFEDVLFLLSGSVRAVTYTFNNRIAIVEDFCGPQNLPFFYLFGRETTHRSSITALTDVSVFTVKKEHFLTLVEGDRLVLINVLNAISSLAQRHHWVMDSISEDVPQLRLASWLLAFSSQPACAIAFKAKEATWQQLLGLDADAFKWAVKYFVEHACITYEVGEVRVIDRYELNAYFQRKIAQKD